MLKLISWNVNGLRACYDKGFTDIFRQLDADFFCLQETKMQAGQLDLQFDGYQSYWNYAEKKGYSGTAVFTRLQPISVSYGMDRTEHDREGRIITLEMEDFFLVNVYTPNSQEEIFHFESNDTALTVVFCSIHAVTDTDGLKSGKDSCSRISCSFRHSSNKTGNFRSNCKSSCPACIFVSCRQKKSASNCLNMSVNPLS